MSSTPVEVFRALGDPVRWTIVNELRTGTRCACELATTADVSAPLLSHHMKVLRTAGLVEAQRRGRWIDYRLVDGALEQVGASLAGDDLALTRPR